MGKSLDAQLAEETQKMRECFLKALALNEDDTVTRLVYADWLDEQGEFDEAQRQRLWPEAKAWLVKLAKESGGHGCNYNDFETITYEDIVQAGISHIDSGGHDWLTQLGGESLRCKTDLRAYWRNWSIVTGRPVPEADQYGHVPQPFSCYCGG